MWFMCSHRRLIKEICIQERRVHEKVQLVGIWSVAWGHHLEEAMAGWHVQREAEPKATVSVCVIGTMMRGSHTCCYIVWRAKTLSTLAGLPRHSIEGCCLSVKFSCDNFSGSGGDWYQKKTIIKNSFSFLHTTNNSPICVELSNFMP